MGFIFVCGLDSTMCGDDRYDDPVFQNNFDIVCEDTQSQNENNDIGIETSDGIIYYEASFKNYFGCIYQGADPNTKCEYGADYAPDSGTGKSLYTGPKGFVTAVGGIKNTGIIELFV